MNRRFRLGWMLLCAVAALLAAIFGCTKKTNAQEGKKAVAVMFTNDVLGEYAPCG